VTSVARKCQKTDSFHRNNQINRENSRREAIVWRLGVRLGVRLGRSGWAALAGAGLKVLWTLSETGELIRLDPLRVELRSRAPGWLPARPQNFRKG
jgi:hypothetical protein